MTKKILVTGSEGYIGQHLCSLLEKQDVDLYKLDK
jgi:nucleoside-diphosphate-sugar epimerase